MLVNAPGEEVMTAPDVVITDHADVITLLTEDQFTLECVSEGMPDPSVTWNHDGQAGVLKSVICRLKDGPNVGVTGSA